MQTTDLLTEKKIFKLDSYISFGGKEIKNIKLGWESYGKLNAKKDNAILVCHPFSSNSHAAGKYSLEDSEAGYWDKIIGPGKAIDTDKYFVLSMDSLVNLAPKNPKVITTGPASINPTTGKEYGMDFPIVTIKDFVNLQRKLVKSLCIKKLYAVIGASMGSMQTYEWAASYPKMVGRIMPVIGAAVANNSLLALTQTWADAITLDKNWNNGDYYTSKNPVDGLALALKLIAINSLSYIDLNKSFQRLWQANNKNPLNDFLNNYKVQDYVDLFVKNKLDFCDANHLLYLVRVNQLYSAGHKIPYKTGLKKITSPTLLIYSPTDTVFYPEEVLQTAKQIKNNGAKIKTLELSGNFGHYDGILEIHKLSKKIKKFIDKKF